MGVQIKCRIVSNLIFELKNGDE